jgi:secretion/DNA translocation related TadE-like protein
VLAAGLALLCVALGFATIALAIGGRHRAEAAADFAALAAASRIGTDGDSCAAARVVADRNGARLTGCSVRLDPDGRSGVVAVSVSRTVGGFGVLPARSVSATARAQRLPVLNRSPGGS